MESLKKLGIDSYLGITTNIPLGYFLSVSIGASYTVSITDLSNAKGSYADWFGQTENNPDFIPSHIFKHKPTKVNNLLLEIGIKYKLWLFNRNTFNNQYKLFKHGRFVVFAINNIFF